MRQCETASSQRIDAIFKQQIKTNFYSLVLSYCVTAFTKQLFFGMIITLHMCLVYIDLNDEAEREAVTRSMSYSFFLFYSAFCFLVL